MHELLLIEVKILKVGAFLEEVDKLPREEARLDRLKNAIKVAVAILLTFKDTKSTIRKMLQS